MKITHTFESDVASPADALLVDTNRLRLAASRPHQTDAPVPGEAPVSWPVADGLSFTAAMPWPRGGLNE